MDSSTIAHDLRAKEWRKIILEANNSDIPKSQYIRDHHLSENSFYSKTNDNRKGLSSGSKQNVPECKFSALLS